MVGALGEVAPGPVEAPVEPALRADGIAKSFGALTALTDASLTVWPGEVVGLIGDNGAGKSTLVKCVSGRIHPDRGTVCVAGEALRVRSPEAARLRGVEVVYQNLALVDSLDVTSNLFLGREVVVGHGLLRWLGVLRTKEMKEQARRILDEVGVDLRGGSVSEPVERLSGGQRQGIAVGRAVVWGQKVVLMDEPAAALGVEQTQHVLDLVRTLRDRSVGVVFISHNMQQVLEVCDRVTVMRRGRTIGTVRTEDVSGEDLVAYITGAAEVPPSSLAAASGAAPGDGQG